LHHPDCNQPHTIHLPTPHTAHPSSHTLSLHDALPISGLQWRRGSHDSQKPWRETPRLAVMAYPQGAAFAVLPQRVADQKLRRQRSEEHTSELQSLAYLVCRLLLEKKKRKVRVRAN